MSSSGSPSLESSYNDEDIDDEDNNALFDTGASSLITDVFHSVTTSASTTAFQTSSMTLSSTSSPWSLHPNSSSVSPTPMDGVRLARTLWMYAGPCIFVIGMIGNIFILAVMSQRRMRGTSTCVYLIWMAASDIIVLVTGMITDWLEARQVVVFKELGPWECKLEKFLFYTAGDTSIWICVEFTIDRFIAVCFPFRQRQTCNTKKAKYCALAATLLAVAKNLHVLWTRGVEYRTRPGSNMTLTELLVVRSNCGHPTSGYRYFEKFVRPWVAFTCVSAIPFCIIVFCNIFIIRAMIRLRRERRLSVILPSQDNTLFQMTALCLSASFCFLVCVTPSMILLIGKPYWNEPPSNWYAIAKSVTNQIFFINHSANFFLYCMTGQRFRLAMRNLLFRCGSSDVDRMSTDPGFQLTTVANKHVSPGVKRRRSTINGVCQLPSGAANNMLGGSSGYLVTPSTYADARRRLQGCAWRDAKYRQSLPTILSTDPRRESVI